VNTPSERREDADAPVADLVAEALDDDRAVGRDDAGRRLLLTEEGDEIPRGERVEPVLALDPLDRGVVRQGRELACRAPDPLAELGGPADALALPERRDAGDARRASSCSSSTETSSSAQIATICCARTSSGFRGMRVSSISPERMARATTADSRRSARNFGKMRPFETDWRS
jgi:hypothetical protein